MLIRLLLMAFGCVAVFWSLRRWKLAVQAALVLVIFEGAIRKWLLPGAQDLVYFAKDVILLGAYVGYFRSRLRMNLPHAPILYASLAIAAFVGTLEIFNPRLPNLLVGVLGFKAYFLYIPLLWVVPGIFNDDAALLRFLRRYALIVFPVVALAIAQFFSPAGSVLNTYAQATEIHAISTFGSSDFVRTTGTFSYISGYTSYLLVTTILILMILTTTRWRFRGNLLIFGALGMGLLGILMSGSRGPIFLLAVSFPLYWWLAVIREKQGGKTFVRLLVGLSLLAAGLNSAGDRALTAYSQRAAGTGDLLGRLSFPFVSPVHMLPYAGLLGYGIGATHQAASALVSGVVPFSWIGDIVPEAESGRVMLELGPIGFFFVYLARIALALFTFRQALRLRTLFHRAVAISALLFFLIQIPGGVVFEVTAGLYYWFLAGLVFTVVKLDRQMAAAPVRRPVVERPLAHPTPIDPLAARTTPSPTG